MKIIPMNVLAGLALGVSLIGATGATAQESNKRVAAETDWSVFVDGNPQQCWGVSQPKNTVNSKDGKPVEVRRGDILLFITYNKGTAGVVSFMGGYPFAKDSTVTMDIGGTKFDLFTDGEGAWAGSPEEDAKIIAALKAGSDVKLTAASGRGTKTEDTFSLMGFTAATEEAEKRCK